MEICPDNKSRFAPKKKMEQRKKQIKCEIWKDIPEYKGMYQASNLGRIRSMDREITQLANGGKTKFTYVKKEEYLHKTLKTLAILL